jgi:hypothetical protein
MQDALAKGEVRGRDVAYLTDRVLLAEGKKQLYGTQAKIEEGHVGFLPIKDEANVEKRRKEVGLQPLSEYREQLAEVYLLKRILPASWMAGLWTGEDKGIRSEELWMKSRGGVMLGVHRDTKDGKCIFFEYLKPRISAW